MPARPRSLNGDFFLTRPGKQGTLHRQTFEKEKHMVLSEVLTYALIGIIFLCFLLMFIYLSDRSEREKMRKILETLLSEDTQLTGREIAKRGKVQWAGIYTLLCKMEGEGHVASVAREYPPVSGEEYPPRRYYRITPTGREFLRELCEEQDGAR